MKTFVNVASMALATLTAGQTVSTQGYTAAGDGGGATYLIVAPQAADEFGDHTLANSNVAKLQRVNGQFRATQFGADALGALDSGLALNALFDAVRAHITDIAGSVEANSASVLVDLEGGTYRTTISLNATKVIGGWNTVVSGGAIFGQCVGKAVVDAIGTRGVTWRDLIIVGDPLSKPQTGIQTARSSEAGYAFCDDCMFDNVTTIGEFSRAGIHTYGQETTEYNHCRFWNSDPTARASIFEGFDTHVMTSDYTTPITGSTSFINNKYLNCDLRYFPAGHTFGISGITKANPAVVSTTAPHNFTNGMKVSLAFVTGMTEVDNISFTIANVTASTFELTGVDSTSYGTFTSGNAVQSNTAAPVFLSRTEGHHFDSCYVVSYGLRHVQIHFADTREIGQLYLDFLFEGAGCSEQILFSNVDGIDRVINDLEVKSYNANGNLRFFNLDGSTNKVRINTFKANVANYKTGISSTPLFTPSTLSRLELVDVDISYPVLTDVDYTSYGKFTGKLLGKDQDLPILIGVDSETQDISSTLLAASSAGVLTAYTFPVATRKISGKTVTMYFDLDITDAGTGSGSIEITLPDNYNTAHYPAVAHGRSMTTGKMLQGWLESNNLLRLAVYDNSTVITASAIRLRCSITYEMV